jgi:hypothetical protein
VAVTLSRPPVPFDYLSKGLSRSMFFPYLLLVLLSPLLLLRGNRYLYIYMIIAAILCGLRQDCLGYDYKNYLYFFENIEDYQAVVRYEPLFVASSYLLSKFMTPQMIFLVYSILLHSALTYLLLFMRRLGIVPFDIMLPFLATGTYFWIAYTIERQSLSIALLMISIPMILIGNRRRSVLFNATAGFFHNAGFSNLLLYGSPSIIIGAGIALFVLIPFIATYLGHETLAVSENVGGFRVVQFIALAGVYIFQRRRIDKELRRLLDKGLIAAGMFLAIALNYSTVLRFATQFSIFLYLAFAVGVRKCTPNFRVTVRVATFIAGFIFLYVFLTRFGGGTGEDVICTYQSI